MNFNIVKRQCDKPLFWQEDEFRNFTMSYKYLNISFDKFLNLLDEYYLFTYSAKLSRNCWLVFQWLRYMSKRDGFVYASYDKIIEVFCKDGDKISKPTFFKCIDELVEKDLITSINTKTCLNGAMIKGCNIYGIVDKTYKVYEICDIIEHNSNINLIQAIYEIESKNKKPLFNVDGDNIKKSKNNDKPKLKDEHKFKLLMNTVFKDIKKDIEEFFVFIGSYNKTGKIALSRKLKILLGLKEYIGYGFDLGDFVYAFNITMRNTKLGNNPYRERYMFKILENMCEYEEVDNEVAEELSKKANDKLQKEYKSTNTKSFVRDGINQTTYNIEKNKIMSIENYYKTILSIYNKDKPVNKYEEHLFKIARAVKVKFDTYDNNSKNDIKRIECMRKRDCFETVGYDDKWNRIINWIDSDGNNIDKKQVYKYFNEDKIDIVYTKYDIVGDENE